MLHYIERMKNYMRVLLQCLMVLGLFACTPGKRTRPQEISYFQHQVMYQGETLGLISRWYTGRTENWHLILDHNPQINAHRIRSGDIIRIPESLISRTDPLPQSYVARAYKEKASDGAQQTDSAASPSASGTLAESAAQGQDPSISKRMEDLGPPEKTLPEAGLTASPDNQGATEGSSAPSGQSRDELLNELLTE